MASLPDFDLDALSVPERLDLIARLWDSIPDSDIPAAFPQWHQEELERRTAQADADPDGGIPWEQVKRS